MMIQNSGGITGQIAIGSQVKKKKKA